MLFIDYKKPGPPKVLCVQDMPLPSYKPNEILVEVKAAGVNRADLYQRAGNYPAPPGASSILGLEIAGTVIKTGSLVRQYKIGDALCGLTNGGGYAEFCAVPETQCLPLPKGLNFIEASSLPEVYFTVWNNLFMRTTLRPKESILIHGGSSGIGSCAIQLAKAFGAHVITTVKSQNKEIFCKGLGADEVINYKDKDFFSLLKNTGVDVVLDIVGEEYFAKNVLLLREEGRLVQVSYLKKSAVALDLSRLLSKRLTIMGSTLRAQSPEAKGQIARELLVNVWPLFNEVLKPVVTAIFPLSRVIEAHQLMEMGEHVGKIVLEMPANSR